jgi:hypothetical protein
MNYSLILKILKTIIVFCTILLLIIIVPPALRDLKFHRELLEAIKSQDSINTDTTTRGGWVQYDTIDTIKPIVK